MAGEVNFTAISGEGANHLEFLPLDNIPINIVASSEDANYPAQNLINLDAIRPWKKWQAAVAAVDDEYIIDKNQLLNPGAEMDAVGDEGLDIAGWTVMDPGVIVVDTPLYAGGGANDPSTRAFAITAAEQDAFKSQRVRVRAGEKITVQEAIRGGFSGTLGIEIFIEELGLYLDTNGTSWTTTQTDWATEAGTTYVLKSASPVIPAYTILVPGGVYTLRMKTHGDGYADSAALWHWTDTATLLGHNAHPALSAVELHCSSDNFNVNDVTVKSWALTLGTITLSVLISPTTWTMFTLRGERWWKYKYVGTNDVPIWNGQPTLSQKYTLTRNPNYGILVETMLAQVRQQTMARAEIVIVKEDFPLRQFTFPFRYHDTAQWREARDRIFQAGRFGKWPTLMIHDDTDPESCAFVRPADKFDFVHRFVNVRDSAEVPLRELAFPTAD